MTLHVMMNDGFIDNDFNDDDGDDFSVTSGNYCNKEIDACYSSPCKNGGACKRREGGFTCLCAPNFAGKVKIFQL